MRNAQKVIRTPKRLDLGRFMRAPVSPATRGGGLIFTSGYVPMDPRTGRAVLGSIEAQTRRTLQNLKLVLEEAGSSLDKVLKVHIFMSDLKEWPRMNKVYREFFPRDYPARRTTHAQLVGGFKIEIDCIALE
jgi:2-iminobutanoate/2-iminopropanoate deaminase